MRKNLNTILTILILTAKNSIKATVKKSKFKNSQLLTCPPSSSMMLSKGSKKTPKRKSSNTWDRFKTQCLKKHSKIRKNLLKSLLKSISLTTKFTAMIKPGNNFNNMKLLPWLKKLLKVLMKLLARESVNFPFKLEEQKYLNILKKSNLKFNLKEKADMEKEGQLRLSKKSSWWKATN